MAKRGRDKKKRKVGSGRKAIVIDWKVVDTYLQAGCDGAAIARLMQLHPDTLYNQVKRRFKKDFSAYREEKKVEGVSMMEGAIFKDAIEHGGVDRMFWLKNKAQWADRQALDHTTKGDKISNLNITVDSPETAAALKELIIGKKTD